MPDEYPMKGEIVDMQHYKVEKWFRSENIGENIDITNYSIPRQLQNTLGAFVPFVRYISWRSRVFTNLLHVTSKFRNRLNADLGLPLHLSKKESLISNKNYIKD